MKKRKLLLMLLLRSQVGKTKEMKKVMMKVIK